MKNTYLTVLDESIQKVWYKSKVRELKGRATYLKEFYKDYTTFCQKQYPSYNPLGGNKFHYFFKFLIFSDQTKKLVKQKLTKKGYVYRNLSINKEKQSLLKIMSNSELSLESACI